MPQILSWHRAFLSAAPLLLFATAPAAAPQLLETNAPASEFPAAHAVVGASLVYRGFSASGSEPWVSNGTQQGTALLQDLHAGTASSSPSEFVAGGGHAYFTATGGDGGGLWTTTGSPPSAFRFSSAILNAQFGNLQNVGGTLYFTAYQGLDTSLWRSDGTVSGTVKLQDGLPPNGGILPGGFTELNGAVYFGAEDGTHGFELWRTDGTAAGTRRVGDDVTGPVMASMSGYVRANGLLFFVAASSGPAQLWRTDGTAAGTRVVKTLQGATPNYGRNLLAVGSTVYFVGRDDEGSELWRSDGTEGGTYRVADICPGPCDSGPNQMVVMGGVLYFVASNTNHGSEVWRSDGTLGGTRMLRDVNPGPSGIPPTHLTVAANRLFFVADDGVNGTELWSSDGTEAGTVMHSDQAPGPTGTEFAWLAASTHGLFFATGDGSRRELWFEGLQFDCSIDTDGDGLYDCAEITLARDPHIRDNDIFTNASLFAQQQFRDFLSREAAPEDAAYWAGQIDSGTPRGELIETFLRSPYYFDAISPVIRLYFAYFLRIPDAGGLGFWINYQRDGNSLLAITNFFAGSAEFQSRYGSLDNGQFVDLVYQNVLGRAPEPGGRAFWLAELDSGRRSRGLVMLQFAESAEFRGLLGSEVDVVAVYMGMLRRAADSSGFAYWVTQLDHGATARSLIESILASSEYRARFVQ